MPGFRLGIYVFKDAEIVDFAAPYGVWSVARRYDPELDAFLIADAMRPVQAQAGFTMLPNYCFDDRPAMDAFLIPGGFGTRQEMYNRRLHEFVSWLPDECLLTSVCTGSWVYGRMGLLDGLPATNRKEPDRLVAGRHTGTASHPRAGHFHRRTVEILRSAGLEEAVRRKGEEHYHPDGGINNVESLAGREIASYFPNLNAGVDEFSPTVRLFIDQDDLEPILRARAEELGAAVRYRVECASLSQDDEGVMATLRDLDGGSERTVRSRYVVAADGN